MKKLLLKILCLFGFHHKKTIGVSEYRTRINAYGFTTKRQLIKQCVHCGQLHLPEWYSKDFRLLHMYVDELGWPSTWRPEAFIEEALKPTNIRLTDND